MSAPPSSYELERQTVELLNTAHDRILKEVSKVIIGQKDVVEQMLIALLCGGHGLITGAPGLAKTLLIKSLSQVFSLRF
jgi:MoxR-like ATPase